MYAQMKPIAKHQSIPIDSNYFFLPNCRRFLCFDNRKDHFLLSSNKKLKLSRRGNFMQEKFDFFILCSGLITNLHFKKMLCVRKCNLLDGTQDGSHLIKKDKQKT